MSRQNLPISRGNGKCICYEKNLCRNLDALIKATKIVEFKDFNRKGPEAEGSTAKDAC